VRRVFFNRGGDAVNPDNCPHLPESRGQGTVSGVTGPVGYCVDCGGWILSDEQESEVRKALDESEQMELDEIENLSGD